MNTPTNNLADIVSRVLVQLHQSDDDTLWSMVASMVATIERDNDVGNAVHKVVAAFAKSMSVHVELYAPVVEGELICVEYGQSYWEEEAKRDTSVHGKERERLLTDHEDMMIKCQDHPQVGSVVVAKQSLPKGYRLRYVHAIQAQNFISQKRLLSAVTDFHQCAAYIVCVMNKPPGLHILPSGFEQLEAGALCPDADGPLKIYCKQQHPIAAVNNAALSVELDRSTLREMLMPSFLHAPPLPRLTPVPMAPVPVVPLRIAAFFQPKQKKMKRPRTLKQRTLEECWLPTSTSLHA